jgi:hypothetical protein
LLARKSSRYPMVVFFAVILTPYSFLCIPDERGSDDQDSLSDFSCGLFGSFRGGKH